MSDIAVGDLRSFCLADLALEITDQTGQTCYVAVEVSYTVNGRDTARAIRNAGYLTRLTGQRAYAAVAGLRHDERVADSITSGEVFWYEMQPETIR